MTKLGVACTSTTRYYSYELSSLTTPEMKCTCLNWPEKKGRENVFFFSVSRRRFWKCSFKPGIFSSVIVLLRCLRKTAGKQLRTTYHWWGAWFKWNSLIHWRIFHWHKKQQFSFKPESYENHVRSSDHSVHFDILPVRVILRSAQ